MLLKLRGGLDSIFVTVLLGVLIGSFAIFGIGSSAFTSSNQQVASVGETPIPTQSYFNRVQNRAQALQAQYGAQFSAQQLIRMMRIDQQVLQQMISEAALKEHISSLGMRAGNQELREELESYEGLVLPDGTLSREMVLQALNNTGLTRADFMDQIRTDISRRQMLNSFGGENLMPRQFAEGLYVWQAERRRATMIDIKAADVGNIPAPDESELLAYYELNKGAYRTQETRSYQYVLVTPQQFMDEIEIAEDKIIEEYESRAADYIQAEQRGLQQVSFSDKAAADAFLVAVNSGADFVEAAVSVTSFTAEEIELGDFAQTELVADYGEAAAAAIFALEEGSVSDAVEGFGGWNVFKIASITPAQEKTLEEAREEVTVALKEYEAEDRMYQMIDVISDAMADESELTAIANIAGLPLATVSDVTARGVTETGEAVTTQAAEFTILREAFSREIGVEADMVDLDPRDAAKGLYLVELSEINEPADRAIDDVRTELTAAWTQEKRLERAAEIAETAKSRLAAGEDAEAIALDINATSFEAKNVARTGDAGSSLAANIRRLIFDLDNGAIDFERSADSDGYVLVRVEEVTPGDPATRTVAVDTLLAQLNTEIVDEIFIQYQGYLLKNYDIDVNTAVQQSLFADTAQQ